MGTLECCQLADQILRCRAVRRLPRDQVDLPGVPAQEARRPDGENAVEMARLICEGGGGSGGGRRGLEREVEGRPAVWHELARAIDRSVGLERLRRCGQAAGVDRRPVDAKDGRGDDEQQYDDERRDRNRALGGEAAEAVPEARGL